MMNFRKISAASKGHLLLRYLTENTPEPIHPAPSDAQGRTLESGDRLTAYYTGRDGRATWRPDMPEIVAEALGIDQHRMPRDAALTRLFEGRRADTGEEWSSQRRGISGLDLVFSPHKSVTLAAEFAPTPSESGAIWAAIDRASDRAMRHVAGVLGWARLGKGGQDGAEPGAVGWVSFRHHTARPTLRVQDGADGETYLLDAPIAGDPHAHIHHFLPNVVVTPTGRVGSIDMRLLTRERVLEFGAYFQAELADELRRLGVRVSYDPKGEAMILDAVPEAVNRAFSKRDREVERHARKFALAQGLDWNTLGVEQKLAIVEEASAAGRLGKLKTDERRIWREQAAALGWQHDGVLRQAVPSRPREAERLDTAYRHAARGLAAAFQTEAVVRHESLAVQAARGLIGAGIPGGTADIDKVVGLLVERGITFRGERVRLLVGHWKDELSVTNTAQVRLEKDLLARAHTAARDRSNALGQASLGAAVAATGMAYTLEQLAAIRALGHGGALSLLTGVAGAGKTTILAPLVAAWKADRRLSERGREVIGLALAWKQATALREAGITEGYAVDPLLRRIESGKWQPTRNTVLVIDEASQIGARHMLALLELQASTGMTIKMLGDREQGQAIEAGDSIELLRRALPPEELPTLLTTVRQATRRARDVATLLREGEAAEALAMKRDDGHAMLVGGDGSQVAERIAAHYVARRDILAASGARKGITISAPTNEDVAEISLAVRALLKERGEITGPEVVYQAVGQNGATFNLPVASGDRLRLFRRTMGDVDGRLQHLGDNGDTVLVIGQAKDGLEFQTKDGRAAKVAWHRLLEPDSGRLHLGFGHALTIAAAQGITSDEHINALPRGTAGVTAFGGYVAESRARGITWTMVAEGALREAERMRQALGDITPITEARLWERAAEDLARKPYKALAIDLAPIHGEEAGVDARIETHNCIEETALHDPAAPWRALRRAREAAIIAAAGPGLAALAAAARAVGQEADAALGDLRPARPTPGPNPSTGGGPSP